MVKIYAMENYIIEKTEEMVTIVHENGTRRGLLIVLVVLETRML